MVANVSKAMIGRKKVGGECGKGSDYVEIGLRYKISVIASAPLIGALVPKERKI